MLLNVNKGTAAAMQNSTFLESASDKLSHAFGNESLHWRMSSDLLASQNIAVFYTLHNRKIEAINVKTMNAYSMTLPFDIESLSLSSDSRWLLQDTSRNTYILQKASDDAPCPNILKTMESVPVGDSNIGVLTGSGGNNLTDSLLSAALDQKISSPNRLLASDLTYASLVVGFPELDGSNEVHVWPRRESVRTSRPPIITENGQVIRTIPPSKVPADALSVDERKLRFSGFLEIVDPVTHTVRYLPIPE